MAVADMLGTRDLVTRTDDRVLDVAGGAVYTKSEILGHWSELHGC
ncbi:hypothetical protein CaCOL14_006938 [Colletotrichum acutatum]